MQTKKFVPCIYLYNNHAVKSLSDYSVVETDPFRLMDSLIMSSADEIIIFDMAETDETQDESIVMIRELISIANDNKLDVIVGSSKPSLPVIHRYIEANASKVFIDLEKDETIAVLENTADVYGKEYVIAAYNEANMIDSELESISNSCSALLLLNPHQIRETIAVTNLPIYVQINQIALNKLLEIFAYPSICGVTGNTINDNLEQIDTLKNFCVENDIPIVTVGAAYKWEDFKLNNDGMVPVIVQDYKNGEVLMLAYMNKEAYDTTIKTGKMTYYSRSRNELWIKGLTSGHFQYVKSLAADCDMDTILAKVEQVGAACHTGSRSCFFNEITRKA